MFRLSERVMTVMTNNYGENHPLVTTVSVGIPTTQILMLLMVCTYIISELTKFGGRNQRHHPINRQEYRRSPPTIKNCSWRTAHQRWFG